MKKVQVSRRKPLGRIICPHCGNDRDFIEVARDVIVTTRYVQNDDGSFTPEETESEILGTVELYCSQCETDVSQFHSHLMEMIF
ncbi:MAG: hypothetical protein Kow0089_09850 [Desulfobulbaceae bacterium]